MGKKVRYPSPWPTKSTNQLSPFPLKRGEPRDPLSSSPQRPRKGTGEKKKRSPPSPTMQKSQGKTPRPPAKGIKDYDVKGRQKGRRAEGGRDARTAAGHPSRRGERSLAVDKTKAKTVSRARMRGGGRDGCRQSTAAKQKASEEKKTPPPGQTASKSRRGGKKGHPAVVTPHQKKRISGER